MNPVKNQESVAGMSLTNKITLILFAAILIPPLCVFSLLYLSLSRTTTNSAISILKKITQTQKSKFVLADSQSSILASVSSDYIYLEETGELLVLGNKNGVLSLLTPLRFTDEINKEHLEKMLVEVSSALGKTTYWSELVDYRGKAVVAVAEPIPELGLMLLAKKDFSEIRKPLQDIGNSFLLIFFTITIVGIFIGLMLSRSLTDPLRQLAFIVAQFTKNPSGRVLNPIHRKDEIGDLAQNFNVMAVKIQENYSEMESTVQEKTASLLRTTSQLESKVKEVERTNSAVLNILEDLEASKAKVTLTTRSLLDAQQLAHIGNWEWDLKDNHVTWSDEHYRLFGLTPQSEQMSYESYLKRIHPDDQEKARNAAEQALKTHKPFEIDYRIKLPNGTFRWIHEKGAGVISDNRGVPLKLTGTVQDITKEKEIDNAKSEFVSLASHQLRTPLTGIEWTTELFSKKEKLSKEGKAYLHDIRFSSRRLSQLIQLLLNVSRIESGRLAVVPTSLDLVGLIGSAMNEYRGLADKKKLSLLFEDHPEKLPIVTDQNLFGYILQNIVSNAIDYTPSGGKVEVAVEKKGEFALLRVKDTGIGIPQKEQAKIFGKFIRASNANEVKTTGSGLGLFIAAEAAKLLGGKIWFESVEGKGSTFFVEVPLVSVSHTGEKGLA